MQTLPIRLRGPWEKTDSFRMMHNGECLRREARAVTVVSGGRTIDGGLEHRWVPERRYARQTDNGWIIRLERKVM